MYRNGRTRQCNPSQAEIASAIGMSVGRVKDGLHELTALGAVERHYIQGRQTTYSLPDFDRDTDASTPSGFTPSTPSGFTPSEGSDSDGVRGRIQTESLIEVVEQTNEQTNEQTAHAENEVPKTRNGKAPYQPSPESERCLADSWEANTPLPRTANRMKCLKVLDTLRKKYSLTWEQIGSICLHASTVWVPQGFIGSPISLLEPTKKKDMATWEKILSQVKPVVVHRPRAVMPPQSW